MSTALSGYLTAIEETKATVQLLLQALSDSLVTNNDLPVIAQVWLTAVCTPRVHNQRNLPCVAAIQAMSIAKTDVSFSLSVVCVL